MSVLATALITAGIGAGLGASSYFWENSKKSKTLERQKDRLKEQRDRNVAQMEEQFKVTQKNAFKSANTADTGTTLSEALLGTSVNGAVRNLASSQKALAQEYNTSLVSLSGNEGAALQGASQSSTRGSSSLQSAAMQKEMSETSLQTQEDYNRTEQDITLAGAMGTMAEGGYNLQVRRTEANDLRTSYTEGGDAYNAYQTSKENYIADVNAQIDALSEQQSYWSLDNIWSSEGWAKIGSNFIDVSLASLQGALSGFGFGSSLGMLQQASAAPAAASTAGSSTAGSAMSFNTGLFTPSSISPGNTAWNYNFGNVSPYSFKLVV